MKHNDDHYQNDNDVSGVMKNEDSYNTETENSFPTPFRELFLWAVLMNRSVSKSKSVFHSKTKF